MGGTRKANCQGTDLYQLTGRYRINLAVCTKPART